MILADPLVLQLPSPTVVAQRVTVAPIRAGLLTSAVEIVRRRQGDGTATASLLLRDAPDITAPVLPTYLSRPVQADPSFVRRPLSATLRRAVEYVDNGFGPVVVEPTCDVFERGEHAEGARSNGTLLPAPLALVTPGAASQLLAAILGS